jgi:ABC-type lipoprotein export system ATPase subunit
LLLELSNVSKSFDIPSGDIPVKVLDNVSLKVDEGESVSIVGPSGSGKSTLLNIIGTLDRPSSGEVFFSGHDLLNCSRKELTEIRNKEIGFIFQLHHLLPQCNVIENVLIPTLADKSKSGNPEIIERAKELLVKVGLQDRIDYFPGRLSGGELQRVAVVRALINNPKLILADEPTGSLDNKASLSLAGLLNHLDEKVSVVMVTHSNEIAALMDKRYRLENGQLNQAG